ncbi:FecR family protein [Chitinophaga qingshengii]|uniref:FecR domain-containing protein n=1 Tax=Chitinophaga qingshengii TaxID=1569794 RepID=A0ABR7TJ93_9BACT|nr:FecR family protein [Chitinophaga qingshengii]MBC9929124.1 FecR domain-containing protein [Chitinophaga qingshengii]
MSEGRIHDLAVKFFQQTCTPAEKIELAQWIEQSAGDAELQQLLERVWADYEPQAQLTDEVSSRIIGDILGRQDIEAATPRVRPMRKWFGYAAAAVTVVALAGGYTRWKAGQPAKPAVVKVAEKKVPQPGGNKATLTMADGSVVPLDSTLNGAVMAQHNVRIVKTDSGLVTYQQLTAPDARPVYNTLTVPRGGQFSLVLADGSKVWLNAQSSLRYPVSFSEGTRTVDLSGEAYFEVSASSKQPFVVKVNDMELTVLGTSFNVMAYPDETLVNTTLLTGKVVVKHGQTSLPLQKGYQAVLNRNTGKLTSTPVNTSEAVAWKNGRFIFNGATVQEIMRQLGRWYNIEVVYAGEVNEQFYAEIPRFANAAEACRILELTGKVHFRLDGQRVTVYP